MNSQIIRNRLLTTTSMGIAAAVVMAAFGTTEAMSQQRQASVFDEIVVTAQKREENLQDVPISVTAFSGNAIRQLNLTNSVDIAGQTPGLNIGTPVGEGNNPSITLRGVGLNDFNDNNESPIAVYIDEVYLGSLAGQTFQLFDLERVEVLRGPQGTLFGRNATGGLVHFVSKKPTTELDYYADATYGRYNTVELEGAVGGPIADNVQARISAAIHEADGYVDNRAGPDRNGKSSWAVRAQVNFDMSENFSLLVNGHAGESDTDAAVYQHQATGPGGTDFFGYADTDGDVFAGAYDRNGVLDIKTKGVNVKMDWDLNDTMSLTSISSYDEVEKLHEEDTDMGPLDLANPIFQLDAEQYSQELRLSQTTQNFNWIVGAYYYKQNVDMPQDLTFGQDLDPTFFLETFAKQDTRSWALFGQGEYNFTEQFSLVLGGRYTDERKEYDYIQIDRLGGVAGTPPGTVLYEFNKELFGDLAVFDKGIFSGKAGLNFRPNEDWLVFASVSRGFKSGGFNAGFTDAAPNQLKYNDERLTAYEAGFKGTFADGLARFNATAFCYDYKDLQALTFDQFSSFITNATDATVKGVELELQANPLDGLDINLGMSYLDSNADNITLPDGSLVSDRRLVLAPKYSVNGLIRYEQPLEVGGALSGQVDFNYQSSHYFDIFNQPLAREGGYSIWNARVAYRLPDDRFEISVWGKNLFNKKYLAYTFDFTDAFGFNQQFYGPPRWWGITLSFRN